MAEYNIIYGIPARLSIGDVLYCPYSGTVQNGILPIGYYKLECWGAQGGYRSSSAYGGKGGYSAGYLNVLYQTMAYFYCGGSGNNYPSYSSGIYAGGFNGGGYRYGYCGGGGATDIRLYEDSLYSRVIVAGGGGSDGARSKTGMYAGGSIGGSSGESFASNSNYCGKGGNTTYSGYSKDYTISEQVKTDIYNTDNVYKICGGFGFGGAGTYIGYGYGGAGGGGWYGGSGTTPDVLSDDDRGGGGGSGFVFTQDASQYCPEGYLLSSINLLQFAETLGGNQQIPSKDGIGYTTGNAGDGYIKITVVETVSVGETYQYSIVKNNTPERLSKQNLGDIVIYKPFGNTRLFYSGTPQYPDWYGVDNDHIEDITMSPKTDVGQYKTIFKLKDSSNCVWVTGDKEPKEIEWSIGASAFDLPEVSEELRYKPGITQRVLLNNYDSYVMSISGTYQAELPGTYTAIVSLIYPEKTVWRDTQTSEPRNIQWEIKRKQISQSSVSGTLTYNGQEQRPTITQYAPEGTISYISGTSGINAGTYTLVEKINDTDKYEWYDGSTSNKEHQWSISKLLLSTPYINQTIRYNGQEQTPTWTYNERYITKLTTGESQYKGTEVGTYYCAFQITDTDNTRWGDGHENNPRNIEWKILIGRIPLPVQNKIYAYTGEIIFTEWSDSGKLNATGDISGTQPDEYTYYLSIKPELLTKYQWQDETQETKSVKWKIAENLDNQCLDFSSETSFQVYKTISWSTGTMEHDSLVDGEIKWVTHAQEWISSYLSSEDNRYHLRFRGTGIKIVGGSSGSYAFRFSRTNTNNPIRCSGRLGHLLDYGTVALGKNPEMGIGCFMRLFQRAPIENVPQLFFDTTPKAVVPQQGLQNTFMYCNLIESDQPIYADTVESEGCWGMYEYCTGLKRVSNNLPQGIIGNSGYAYMFNGCTSLESVAYIQNASTVVNNYSYQYMFSDCTSLEDMPLLPATDISGCACVYRAMFSGCASLKDSTQNKPLPALSIKDSAYEYMFNGCTSLTKVPFLPATSVGSFGYLDMFRGCTGITEMLPDPDDGVVKLPATTLGTAPYARMFYECSNLTNAPEVLPATSTPSGGYFQMFYGCSSLLHPPLLPATTLNYYSSHDWGCYEGMFSGCSSLTLQDGFTLPALSIATDSYFGMFEHCTSLTLCPELPATYISPYGYYSMFYGCTGIVAAPELPSRTVKGYAYKYMFEDCTSLTDVSKIKLEIDEDTLPISAYYGMFSNTAIEQPPEIVFPENLENYSCQEMFKDCVNLRTSPELTAKNIKNSTYQSMFEGCTSLTEIPKIHTETMGGQAFDSMFKGCVSLSINSSTIPELPTSKVEMLGYNSMFEGCTSLRTAPIIKANTIAQAGCRNMFKDCINLVNISDLSAENVYTNKSGYYGSYHLMFNNCTSLETPPNILASTLYGSDNSYLCYLMFQNCSKLKSIPRFTNISFYGGYYMFSGCSSLIDIELPDNVSWLQYTTFDGASKIRTLTIRQETPPTLSATLIRASNSYICVPSPYLSAYKTADYWKNISDHIIAIGDDLVKYRLNDNNTASVESCGDILSPIGEIVIRSEYLGRPVVSIDANAFKNKTELSRISIPSSITQVGNDAFLGCNNLTIVNTPSIESWAQIQFAIGSSNPITRTESLYINGKILNNLVLYPTEEMSIGSYAFIYCKSLTSVDIGQNVKQIGQYAFYGCYSLSGINMSEGITSVDYGAFEACGLTSIVIPNTVTNIGQVAFAECSYLVSATIGNGVTSIGSYAFYECEELISITSLNTSPPTLGESVFYEVPSSAIVYVPASSVEAYKSASGWSEMTIKALYSTGLSFTPELGTDNCKVTGMGTCTDTVLAIPDISNDGNDWNVIGIGDSAFKNNTNITGVIIPDSVTSIGMEAFKDCVNLVSITPLNTDPPTLGQDAFDNISQQAVVYVKASAYANYKSTDGWKDMNIYVEPSTGLLFEQIEDTNTCTVAMGDCTDTEVVIPSKSNDGNNWNVVGIAYGGFDAHGYVQCVNITNIIIPTSVKTLDMYAFCGCSGIASITIPNSVTSIERGAFYGCSGLTSITIPNSVTSIGWYAFSGCSGLTSISVNEENKYYYSEGNCLIETDIKTLIAGCKNSAIPNDGSVTTIGYGAFSGIESLVNITIPNSIISIEFDAFYGIGATEITIPKSVTSIGNSAFGGNFLQNLQVDSENIVYHSESNCVIKTQSNELICGCKNSAIPNGVTSIGDLAFYDCSGLTSITIPNSVTCIGDGAFYGSGLTSIDIPDSVTSIGEWTFGWCPEINNATISNNLSSVQPYTFYHCSELASITIPSSVTSIGEEAFCWCGSLESITIMNKQCAIYDSSFTISNSATIYGYANSTAQSYAETYSRTFLEIT